VPGLSRADFEIYENKVRQQIEYFSHADTPASIGIIFDASGSMVGKLAQARAALQAFIQTSHPEDDFFVIGFNRQPRLLLEFTDAATLVRRLDLLEAGGETALYDAAYLGAEKVRQGRHAKRTLLIISDGEDNYSRYQFGQLRQLLKEANVQVYCIGVGITDEARQASAGRMILDEMAKLTGGKAFFVRSAAELEEATSRIALELRQQYSLGYTPTNAERDGKWRDIKVRVNRQSAAAQVRAKPGYYAVP
jgi:Ca-activated chloride channel homolog